MEDKNSLKTLNLMWVDIVGSDLQMKNLGISAYAQRLGAYYEIIDAICTTFSVNMVDTLGDGVSMNSFDNSTESLIKTFFAIKNEVNASLDLDVKAGIHTGEVYTKNITLKGGMRIPLVVGAINETFRLETFCKVNKTSLLLSPEAYSRIESEDMKKSFILNRGAYKRKSTLFNEVYRYSKFF